MLFLIQTVSRQFTEQREYSPKGVEPCPSKRRAQAATAKGDPHFPDHDLEPPKFARKALELIIQEWSAVKNMVMSGSKDTAGARYVSVTLTMAKYVGIQISVCYLNFLCKLRTFRLHQVPELSHPRYFPNY